ncbi:hypothetical protein H2509_12075 [Stappia sp. F7233]|uniref:Uncharacterized protein n=1 Tax=Stappia albiluteola TaxID=2758565 RepID=A0A839ADK5_9HYPH|nr:hypothetical protein [Stappia albiluteola]MBA5777860.1 hypothetical protein [Stappia albiluteola]
MSWSLSWAGQWAGVPASSSGFAPQTKPRQGSRIDRHDDTGELSAELRSADLEEAHEAMLRIADLDEGF